MGRGREISNTIMSRSCLSEKDKTSINKFFIPGSVPKRRCKYLCCYCCFFLRQTNGPGVSFCQRNTVSLLLYICSYSNCNSDLLSFWNAAWLYKPMTGILTFRLSVTFSRTFLFIYFILFSLLLDSGWLPWSSYISILVVIKAPVASSPDKSIYSSITAWVL